MKQTNVWLLLVKKGNFTLKLTFQTYRPTKLPEKCRLHRLRIHFVFVHVSSELSNWFILIWKKRTYLSSSTSIPDSSFCCWSSDDEIAEFESLSAKFLWVQIRCKQNPRRPSWSSCKPCDVTTHSNSYPDSQKDVSFILGK